MQVVHPQEVYCLLLNTIIGIWSQRRRDGMYPEELTWTYDDVPEQGIHKDYYNYDGPGLCL